MSGSISVSTAAEETKNPQRNVPIGLIGSLLICTVFYILVAGGAIGDDRRAADAWARRRSAVPGRLERARPAMRVAEHAQALVCSNEALAHVLRTIGFSGSGQPARHCRRSSRCLRSILVLLFGQTRIFFVMSRDGLLPEVLSTVHPKFKTPYVVTAITGGCRWRWAPRSFRSGNWPTSPTPGRSTPS